MTPFQSTISVYGKAALAYFLAVSVMVGTLLVWNLVDRYRDYEQHQLVLAKVSAQGVARAIETSVQQLRRMAALVAERERPLLQVLAARPEDTAALERLRIRVGQYFPNAASVKLLQRSVLEVEDRELAAATREICFSDPQVFMRNWHAREVLVRLPPSPHQFHVIVPLESEERASVALDLAFPADLIAGLLASRHLSQHELLLVQRESGAVVEISGHEGREDLGGGKQLSQAERDRIIYRVALDGTCWDIVDLPLSGVATLNLQSLVLKALVTLLFFVVLGAFGFRALSRYEQRAQERARQLAMANAELRYQSLHDPVTGLANQTLLNERLEQSVLTCQRTAGLFALMLVDLERFREIIDTLGYPVGDQLLRQAGNRLKELLRESDTVARIAGDTFAVIIKVDGAEQTALVAGKVLDEFAQPFSAGEALLVLKVHIGVALFPLHARDAEGLIRCANAAMFRASRDGVGCSIYEQQYDPSSMDRLALIARLRNAIDQGEMELRFQPKVSATSGALRGAEVLVRWRHPQHGVLQPGAFLHLAEQSGAIAPLTRWVLERALAVSREFAVGGQMVCLAVNLSARVLDDERFPSMVGEMLKAKGVPPDKLQLEITESAAMADSVRAQQILERLEALGVRLSIDDFGVGYSSLAYLKRLPVVELKIDKTFVLGMVADEKDAAIVRCTVRLGHDLGLKVVAEGVDSPEIKELLGSMGCDILQGYFISPPLTADQLNEWISRESTKLP